MAADRRYFFYALRSACFDCPKWRLAGGYPAPHVYAYNCALTRPSDAYPTAFYAGVARSRSLADTCANKHTLARAAGASKQYSPRVRRKRDGFQ